MTNRENNDSVIEREIRESVMAYLKAHSLERLDLRAALFDMDGTLYDSMPRHADAWMQMCRANGINARRDEFFLFEGRTGASTINILFERQFGHPATPEQTEELYRQKTVNFKAMPKPPVMPGAIDVTRLCAEAGLECILVTGSGQKSLLDRLSGDFPGIFDPVKAITSRDVVHGKPSPEPYQMAMHRVGCSVNDNSCAGCLPEQAIIFENAPLGVQSGAASGAFTVAVVTGPVPREELAAAGASIIFDSMPMCAEHLPRLLQCLTQADRNFNQTYPEQ